MVHGTATGWRHHRCRCEECHRALLAEGRLTWAMRRVQAGSDPAMRTLALPVRKHLRKLEAAGLTRSEIARRAGVSAGTISRLANTSTRRVSRITAARVLGVMPLPEPVPLVDVGPLPEPEPSGTWVDRAACRGRTALFYSEDRRSERLAVAICQRCPVRAECLADALATEPEGRRFGVVAGLTPRQRGPRHQGPQVAA